MGDEFESTIFALVNQIRDHIKLLEAENARLSYIKATIHINALRNGASKEDIIAMQNGETSFIQWMSDNIQTAPLTNAQLRADPKIKALVRAAKGLLAYSQKGYFQSPDPEGDMIAALADLEDK